MRCESVSTECPSPDPREGNADDTAPRLVRWWARTPLGIPLDGCPSPPWAAGSAPRSDPQRVASPPSCNPIRSRVRMELHRNTETRNGIQPVESSMANPSPSGARNQHALASDMGCRGIPLIDFRRRCWSSAMLAHSWCGPRQRTLRGAHPLSEIVVLCQVDLPLGMDSSSSSAMISARNAARPALVIRTHVRGRRPL